MVALTLIGNFRTRHGFTELVEVMARYILAASIGMWIVADARRTRRSVSYDFGMFLFFAWSLLAPIHLFKTRGWRGFGPIGWFVLIVAVATLVGSIPSWVWR